MRPRVLIPYANGTNRDRDLADAFEHAGATPITIPLSTLIETQPCWENYQMLALPGGFVEADILGAGKLLALTLNQHLGDLLQHFIAHKKPIIGICNGFQALIKAGLLPALKTPHTQPEATLTHNAQGHFECRWVTLLPSSQRCLWTRDLSEPIDCPIAHGEGQFLVADPIYRQLDAQDQIVLRYARPNGQVAQGHYPNNPNGSTHDIAGICNPEGNILGLMPHPENAIFPWQHPQWTRGIKAHLGLSLFQQGVRYA